MENTANNPMVSIETRLSPGALNEFAPSKDKKNN